MVPPKKYRYFFTVNNETFLDPNIAQEILALNETHSYEMNHEMKILNVQKVNYRKGKAKKIVNEWGEIIIKTLPRSNGITIKKEKEPWQFDKSVWAKEYKVDNEELLRKCFEKDWKCSKLTSLIKVQADQDKVKDILWGSYAEIKNLYRYFSSWAPFGDIWAVSSNTFTDFCQQSKIISKDTPLKITDLTFITTNSMSGANYKGNCLVPERGLVRFQFM
jgi:NLR family CARD domain-containing protein 3